MQEEGTFKERLTSLTGITTADAPDLIFIAVVTPEKLRCQRDFDTCERKSRDKKEKDLTTRQKMKTNLIFPGKVRERKLIVSIRLSRSEIGNYLARRLVPQPEPLDRVGQGSSVRNDQHRVPKIGNRMGFGLRTQRAESGFRKFSTPLE